MAGTGTIKKLSCCQPLKLTEGRIYTMKHIVPVLAIIAVVAGCSSNAPAPKQQVEASLAAPIDCSTAQQDIALLNSEKARTSQEIEDGASSIIPIGAVAHLFGGSEKESIEIGTGQYNKKLDDKIAEIKSACGMK